MMGRWISKFFHSMPVFLYRRSGGRIMGKIGRMTILLLTTTGRKTGKSHTTPLGYITDGGNYIVVASNGGKNVHPAWWLNLEHNPQAMIQIGETQKPVVTERAAGDEENRLWGEVTKVEPAYGNYRSLSRGVPIVILHPQTE